MPDSRIEVPVDDENRKTIELLREKFGPVTQRLSPEIEPATIYRINSADSGSGRKEHVG